MSPIPQNTLQSGQLCDRVVFKSQIILTHMHRKTPKCVNTIQGQKVHPKCVTSIPKSQIYPQLIYPQLNAIAFLLDVGAKTRGRQILAYEKELFW